MSILLDNVWKYSSQQYVHQERNKLLSLLSALYPASLEKHQPENEAARGWSWLVIIDLPTGQCSWHIQDSELPYFDHLEQNAGRKWDGTEEEEKYQRIEELRQYIKSSYKVRIKKDNRNYR